MDGAVATGGRRGTRCPPAPDGKVPCVGILLCRHARGGASGGHRLLLLVSVLVRPLALVLAMGVVLSDPARRPVWATGTPPPARHLAGESFHPD